MRNPPIYPPSAIESGYRDPGRLAWPHTVHGMGLSKMNTTDMDALAARLAAATPCAGALDDVDFGALSATGRIDAAVACVRYVACAQALLVRALGALDAARDE